jgi:hypothetical protein
MRRSAALVPIAAVLCVLVLGMGFGAGYALAHTTGYPHKHPPRKPPPPTQPKAAPEVVTYVVAVGKPHKVKPVYLEGKAAGLVDLVVKPRTTKVFVDGKPRGVVDQYDGKPGYLRLLPGEYLIKLVAPDGTTVTQKVPVKRHAKTKVKVNLT